MSKRKLGKNRLLAPATIACAFVGGGAALAQPEHSTIAELVAASNLVIQSRVAKIEYRTDARENLPYTIVTYNVLKVVRGNPSSKSITLRFVGGPDGKGHFVSASHVPTFQTGDEDILFIQSNGETSCPLVNCISGRFRVLNGALYDGNGSPVRSIGGDRIVSGGEVPAAFRSVKFPAPNFDELIKNPEVQAALRQQGLSIAAARARYNAQSPGQIEFKSAFSEGGAHDGANPGGPRPAQQPAESKPIEVGSFLAVLKSVAASAQRQPEALRSTNVNAPVTPPSTGAAPPPALPHASQPATEDPRLPKDDYSPTRNKAQ